ncbi:FAD-linked oxidoreductase-like protein [Mariannaea sp. PMI_226]|nr:FAD-linked oxidoreductase-like protein [Mariannaea sp. PMI_226]
MTSGLDSDHRPHTADVVGPLSNASTKPTYTIPKESLALSKLPMKIVIRSAALTTIMATSWLLRPSLAIMSLLTRSKSAMLDADKNLVINRVLRWTVYDHFCAGINPQEVTETVKEVKKLGYHGVILGYAKEVVLENPSGEQGTANGTTYGPAHYKAVDEWTQGNLDTLEMLGAGDFIALKVTGAGPIALDAMQAGQPVPEPIENAINEICRVARTRGCRVWFDAEQQALQPTLDEWCISMMRKHNRGGEALIFNTIQAYLKGARANAERHIMLAAKEGWTVAVKLVRGAYIENEVRSLIHDTKEDTDRSYNAIADMFLSRRMPEGAQHLAFPDAAFFLATHNAESVEKALETHKKRVLAGQPITTFECAQILGMADELSCKLLQEYEEAMMDPKLRDNFPRIHKAIPWGSVGECLGYLYRRSVENRGAVERTHHMAEAMRKEFRRRILG